MSQRNELYRQVKGTSQKDEPKGHAKGTNQRDEPKWMSQMDKLTRQAKNAHEPKGMNTNKHNK
jgi:hypothetical protein